MLPWVAMALAGEPGCRAALDNATYAAAFDACTQCGAEPGPRAAWCTGRVAWLERRRDPSGGWSGAERLEEVRRGREGKDAAQAVELDPAVADTVRAEAAIWLTGVLRDEGDLRGAETVLARWDRHPALPPEVSRIIGVNHASVLAEQGQDVEAEAALDSVRVATLTPHPTPVDLARSQRRGKQMAIAAITGVAVYLSATVGAVRRGTPAWHGTAILAAVFLGAWVLLEGWERGAGAPVWWLSATLLPVVAWSGRALQGVDPARRGRLRIAGGLCTLAAGWLGVWMAGVAPWP